MSRTMDDLLQGLNDRQREAVLATEGPVLIVAGAGAGKTKTLSHRIGHLIANGVPGEAILAITFTNKAAREMRERVFRLLGRQAAPVWAGVRPGIPWIGTFHALGVHMLREKGEMIGIPKRFTILDADDARSAVKRAIKACGLDLKEFEPGKIAGLISRQKNALGDPRDSSVWERISSNKFLMQMTQRVALRYEADLREAHALDFDDLLVRSVKLLEEAPDALAYFQHQWRYFHVDEYQDTNDVQYRLVHLLSQKSKNICVVGDPDQNVYQWRGASIANILNFEEDFPGTKVVLLEENYRSTKKILDASNAIIKKNTLRKDKNLFTRGIDGEHLLLREAYDESDEARWVARKIAALMEEGVRPGAIAVLYRTNFQSRALEEALLYAGIPHQVLGVRFFERKEVKDVLAYIRAALNPSSTLDIARVMNVPARGLGAVTLEKILAGKRDALPSATRAKVDAFYGILAKIRGAAESMSPSVLVRFAVKESGIEKALTSGDDDDLERLGNVRELATLAAKYDALLHEDGLAQFLADVALLSDQDNMNETRDAVRLMTVHAAKGLEFPYVFVTGLEDGLFPSRRARDGADDLSAQEEERRLFYVALTRAAKRVFLTYAGMRTIFGQKQFAVPSEFLGDIPEHLVEAEVDEAPPKFNLGNSSRLSIGGRPDPSRKKFSLLDPLDGDEDAEDILYF